MKKIVLLKSLTAGLILSQLIFSCGSGTGKKTKEKQDDWSTSAKTEKTGENATTSAVSNSNVNSNAITIQRLNGNIVGTINSKGAFSFTLQGHDFISKLNGDKRKYQGNNAVTEVKYKDDGFKLRSADGKLLWKVKITEDKIKISNNEEGKNPLELKLSENEKAKVKKDDHEIGKIKFNASKKEIEAGDFIVKADKLSLAYCILLATEIPERDKFILMTEIIGKGK
jgi:hypothetical protein